MNYIQNSKFCSNGMYGVLTVDIGTSGCRAILFNNDGVIVYKTENYYSCNFDGIKNGCAEQNPEEIYNAFVKVVKRCILIDSLPLKYVVLGSVLHSLVLLDKFGIPITPLSIWADVRANLQCQKLQELYFQNAWCQKTGCPLSPSYPLYRLLWYKENYPELYKKFSIATSIKSYIVFRLFGCYLEDYSVASGTGMFNLFTLDWDDEILEYLELDRNRFPGCVPTEHVITGFAGSINGFGLSSDVCWIIGSSDGPLAHLGGSAYSPDTASLTIGSSGAVRVLSKIIQTSSDDSIWCYILDSKSYVFGIATNNGGNVVDWYVKRFLPGNVNWLEINEKLRDTAFDPDLIFVPFLFEERYISKYTDNRQNFPSSFTGVKYNHTAFDLLRVVIEGVIFNICSLFERLKSLQEIKKITTSGMLTGLPFVHNLLSTMIDAHIVNRCNVNASLVGALRLVMGVMGEDFDRIENHLENNQAEINLCKYNAGAFNIRNNEYSEKYRKWQQLCCRK